MFKKVTVSLLIAATASLPLKLYADTLDYSDSIEEILDETKSINQKFKKYLGDSGDNAAANLAKIPTIFMGPSLNQTLSQYIALMSYTNSYKQAKNSLNDMIFGNLVAAPDTSSCTSPGGNTFSGNNGVCARYDYKGRLQHYGYDIPLAVPYAEGADNNLYNFNLANAKKNNSALLSPESIFGKTIFKNLENPIPLKGTDKKIKSDAEVAGIFSDFLVNPVPPKLNKQMGAPKTESTLNYNIKLRAFAAYSALLRGNMEDMIALRKPLPGLDKPTSLLSIEEKMATRRINKYYGEDGSWYDKMEKANALAVQREIAYLLAEMNYQLYLNRRMNEKMLATMTAVGAGSLDMRKPQNN